MPTSFNSHHFMAPRCRRLRQAIAFLAPIAIASLTFAANPPADAPVFSAATLSHDQVTALEADLATLMQRRLDATGPELTIIDYQIDLRLLERWMLSTAADPKASEATQACIALRVATLQSAGEEIARRLQGNAMLPSQVDGLAKLHDLTYKLPPIKTMAALDDVCKTITTDLILAANPAPAEVNHLPTMRPKASQGAAPQTAPAVRTLADLTGRAKEVQVSPALKRQLLALSAAAETAANADTKNDQAQEELTALYDGLSAVIDLSDGLERNVGIDTLARPKVEQQLTEGVALFTDPRTRSSGAQRIAGLSQYRATLLRIQHLRVPNAMQQKIAPAYIWINNNPDSAAPVLNAIEKYLQLCTRADGSSSQAAGLTPLQRKTVDSLQKQFLAQRNGFLEDAANLGGKGGFLATSPSNLADHCDTMGHLLDSIESIEKLPQAIAVLLSLHPKPAGALERRQVQAFADMNSSTITPTHEASLQFIADVERLALLADTPAPPSGISPAILKFYTHDRLPQVQTRRAALLSDLASQVATGKPLDSTEVAKIQILHDLMDSLALAIDVENCLAKSDLLSRWADWAITPPQIKALVSPYRDATASAFDGFADDNATPLFRWPDQHKRYLPVLLLAREAGSYADQCNGFPIGLAGDFARLLTPMENQPFAIERDASLGVSLWQASAMMNDQKITDDMFEGMLGKLAKTLVKD